MIDSNCWSFEILLTRRSVIKLIPLGFRNGANIFKKKKVCNYQSYYEEVYAFEVTSVWERKFRFVLTPGIRKRKERERASVRVTAIWGFRTSVGGQMVKIRTATCLVIPIVLLFALDGTNSSAMNLSKPQSQDPRTCNSEPTNNCNCQCNVFQDSRISDAVEALAAKLVQLTELVNKTYTKTSPPSPPQGIIFYMVQVKF